MSSVFNEDDAKLNIDHSCEDTPLKDKIVWYYTMNGEYSLNQIQTDGWVLTNDFIKMNSDNGIT